MPLLKRAPQVKGSSNVRNVVCFDMFPTAVPAMVDNQSWRWHALLILLEHSC